MPTLNYIPLHSYEAQRQLIMQCDDVVYPSTCNSSDDVLALDANMVQYRIRLRCIQGHSNNYMAPIIRHIKARLYQY